MLRIRGYAAVDGRVAVRSILRMETLELFQRMSVALAVGVLIVVAYYILNIACEFLVTTLVISPFAGAWMPNGLFALLTCWLFWRMSRQ